MEAREPDRLFEAYVLDLDGTVYLGDGLLPGAREGIEGMRERGKVVRYLSNNPTRDLDEYAEKLTGLGLPTEPSEIVTTIVTTTRWLLAHAPGAVVFPIAEAPLKAAFAEAGIAMSEDPEEIDLVVASFDRAFEYRKLQIAFDAIHVHGRARLIATNPDRYCPLPEGRGEPDCAAITAAIEACTGARCEAVLGKPSAAMLDVALEDVDADRADCLMVGDRLHTDIRMGLEAGMPTALVLSGETGAGDLRDLPPDEAPPYVVERLDQLLPD
jgi:HAD superfamily hydrolase (TIGR01450 family)